MVQGKPSSFAFAGEGQSVGLLSPPVRRGAVVETKGARPFASEAYGVFGLRLWCLWSPARRASLQMSPALAPPVEAEPLRRPTRGVERHGRSRSPPSSAFRRRSTTPERLQSRGGPCRRTIPPFIAAGARLPLHVALRRIAPKYLGSEISRRGAAGDATDDSQAQHTQETKPEATGDAGTGTRSLIGGARTDDLVPLGLRQGPRSPIAGAGEPGSRSAGGSGDGPKPTHTSNAARVKDPTRRRARLRSGAAVRDRTVAHGRPGPDDCPPSAGPRGSVRVCGPHGVKGDNTVLSLLCYVQF